MLFIGGYGRIGSTLLDRMLGQAGGFVSAGEVRYVWNVGYRQNLLCGCRRPFGACPFWRAVTERAFGGLHRHELERIRTIQLAIDHLWYMPQMAGPLRTRRYEARLGEYRHALGLLYRAIRDVSGAEVIVDSSKAASHACLLRGAPGLDVRVAHLVRDPRASAFSYLRTKVRPEVHWSTEYMPRHSPLRSAVEWDVNNLAVWALQFLGMPYHLVRYEDLMADPARTLRDLTAFAGRQGGALDFLLDGHARLGESHMACGNPSRYDQGVVPLRLDEEWTRALNGADRVLVSSLTWPLRTRYGYGRTPRAGR